MARAVASDGRTGQVDGEEHAVAPPDAKPAVECDACGGPVVPDDDEGYGLPGEGVYLWTRGDEVRFERAPLCASCAAAIGMAALARWEIEEEEG